MRRKSEEKRKGVGELIATFSASTKIPSNSSRRINRNWGFSAANTCALFCLFNTPPFRSLPMLQNACMDKRRGLRLVPRIILNWLHLTD